MYFNQKFKYTSEKLFWLIKTKFDKFQSSYNSKQKIEVHASRVKRNFQSSQVKQVKMDSLSMLQGSGSQDREHLSS